MNDIHALRELYRHHDWAAQRLIAEAAALEARHLDHPFEMGFGSLRKTLWHNARAHSIWMNRIRGESPARFTEGDDQPTLEELQSFWAEAQRQRDAIIDSATSAPPGLDREIAYSDMKGNPHKSKLGEILLHVANHAQHHHAQASNMLRHLGAKSPRLDYIFMIHETKPAQAPLLSTMLLRDYFAYTDWARERVMNVVAELDDAALDRPFEIGTGSIRRNMTHIHDAEAWWLRNWTVGAAESFPRLDDHVAIPRLRTQFAETSARRNEFLAGLGDDDLLRPVEALAAPGKKVTFPLGVTMLQLCNHGTHHRAQTINMLRQCGKTVASTDLIVWKRELRSAARPT